MTGSVGLIIPSYQRPHALRRAVDYWSQSALPVIIVDGSADRADIASTGNIKYEHHPKAPMQIRILEAARHFNTDYLIICADDDFFGFSAIKIATEFLDKSPEFSAIQGWGATFSYDGRTLDWTFPDYRSEKYVVDDIDPIKRIHSLFDPYRQVLWSVYRRNAVIEGWETIAKVTNLLLHEINQNVISAISGNVKTLPIFLNARDRTPGVSLLISPERRSFPDWILDPATSTEREWWKESVGKVAKKYHPHIDSSVVHEALDDVLKTYSVLHLVSEIEQKYKLKKLIRGLATKFEPMYLKQKRWAARLSHARSMSYPLELNNSNHEQNSEYLRAAQQDWKLIRNVILKNKPAV